jgi:hypothetical protein
MGKSNSWMKAFKGLVILSFLFVGQAYGANDARLYDFEEGTSGGTTNSVADKIDTLLFTGTNGADGLLWLEVPGGASRPLPAGGIMDAVNSVGLTAPSMESFVGAITFEDVSDGSANDSPQPGSTLAARFDGSTVFDDFNSAGGSRGVYVDQLAYDANDAVASGGNTFESFSLLTQAWVRPDSSAMGTPQTVWQAGSEQGAIRISDDPTPVWEVLGLGGAFPDGGLFPQIPVAFDEWTHIGIFRGGNGAEYYINGELVIGDRNPDPPMFFGAFATVISIGGTTVGDEPFTGLIDDFKLSGFADTSLNSGDMDYCLAAVCPQPEVSCDFDGDGNCDITDLDALVQNIVSGANDAAFDLTGDGVVDANDITDAAGGWLTLGGAAANNAALTGGNPFLVGDANLDGVVDVSDFNLFNANKFTDTSLWSLADFNADGVTDVADFNVWNANKFQSSSPAAVPEPAGFALLFSALLGLFVLRR